MRSEFYNIETFEKIMNLEESRGRLKEFCYSQKTKDLSFVIKELRQELRAKKGDEREHLKLKLEEYNQLYEESKKSEIADVYKKVINGKHPVILREVEAKGKEAYTVGDMPSLLISKFVAIEIKNQYQLHPANRDEIVEELRVLLDNPMPKILIRTDIRHFYESVPQAKLIDKLESDAYLSAVSTKYLRKFFYEYNYLTNNKEQIGLPRGLSFSPALAEIYLQEFDRKIRSINGVYFYKRYVDDIVLLANPNKVSIENCWKLIKEISGSLGLDVHEYDDKVVRAMLGMGVDAPVRFNYLGYQFYLKNGRTHLLLPEEKVVRYFKTIDCVLKAYAKVANNRTKGEQGGKQTDGLIQMIHRIDALTGNGNLDSRRNFVMTGLFYSNRLLTDLSQLDILDRYLADAFNDEKRFSPPRSLFNYGEGNSYADNVARIKKKILTKYSFKTGFCNRRMYRWKDYVVVLKQLQNLYYKSL